MVIRITMGMGVSYERGTPVHGGRVGMSKSFSAIMYRRNVKRFRKESPCSALHIQPEGSMAFLREKIRCPPMLGARRT
jgi:hypothetical protein